MEEEGATSVASAAASAAADATVEVLKVTTTKVTLTQDTGASSLVPELSNAILFLIAVSIALVLITAYLVTRGLASGGSLKPKRRNITLILGTSGSGKTTLLRQLQHGKVLAGGSVTSVVPNEAECTLGKGEGEGDGKAKGDGQEQEKKEGKTLRVVDYPGHEKLRSGAAEYLEQTTKVVFVTDSLVYNQSAKIRDAASFLFTILSDPTVLKHKVPVFLACNKSERMNAFSPEFIKKKLEKEIDVILSTVGDLSDTNIKGGDQGDSGAASQLAITTAEPGKPFKFAECLSKVSCGAISASKGKLKPLQAYLLS